jgi:hypothetical protein
MNRALAFVAALFFAVPCFAQGAVASSAALTAGRVDTTVSRALTLPARSDPVNGSTPNVAGSQLVRYVVGPGASSWYVEY